MKNDDCEWGGAILQYPEVGLMIAEPEWLEPDWLYRKRPNLTRSRLTRRFQNGTGRCGCSNGTAGTETRQTRTVGTFVGQEPC